VATVYPKISEQGGRPPIPLERMLRIYFLQLWFNLSDPAVEQELYDSAAMRKFLGIDLGTESAPDETTICKFRHLLEKNKLGKTLLRAGGERVGCAGAASSAIALTQTRNFTNSGTRPQWSRSESLPRIRKCMTHRRKDPRQGQRSRRGQTRDCTTPNGEVEGLPRGAQLEPRVHTVFPHPRRHYRRSRSLRRF